MKKEIENSKSYYITSRGVVLNSKGKALKAKQTAAGYMSIGIPMKDGSRKFFTVHRLVAKAFIENPEGKPHVNHIDGVKTNNNLDNLEWVTPRENMQHCCKVLRKGVGSNSGMAKLDEATAHEICKMLQNGYRNFEIALTLNNPEITPAMVTQIRCGVTWKEISEQYKIPKKSRLLSDRTIRWLCEKLEEGLSTSTILAITRNAKLTQHIVKDVRQRRIYTDISKDYCFN